jgi:hypothetical protein
MKSVLLLCGCYSDSHSNVRNDRDAGQKGTLGAQRYRKTTKVLEILKDYNLDKTNYQIQPFHPEVTTTPQLKPQ